MDDRKLPQPLYHGTHCKNADSILEEGLQMCYGPSCRESLWDAGESYLSGVPPRMSDVGIYLSTAFNVAHAYAGREVGDEDDDSFEGALNKNKCVIEVDCLAPNTRLGPDGFGELMTNGKPIPARCIKKVWYPRGWKGPRKQPILKKVK